MGAADSGPDGAEDVVARNRAIARRVFDECFNLGRVELLPELVAVETRDHQHPDEPDFVDHLRTVILAMRTAFPDLHFAITEMIGEGDWVATHSVMAGTHLGPLRAPLIPANGPPVIPPTSRAIRVPHMHMIRSVDGKGVELLHLMDTFAMMKQLGLLPGPPERTATTEPAIAGTATA